MPLALLLALLGAAALPNAGAYTVELRTDGPEGIRGVACDHDWLAVPGNAQHLCHGLDDGLVIYINEIDSRAELLDTLAHEWFHHSAGMVEGEDAWERFQEGRAYAFGEWYARRNAAITTRTLSSSRAADGDNW
jgi:hypothetical protein